MTAARRARALPTATQLLVLRAATGDAATARAAWEAFRCRVAWGEIDGESYWLLPLCYRNLRRVGVGDALDGRLAGTYKRTWLKNRLVLARAAAAITALAERGIASIVLKGAAMAILHYRDAGARVMEDVDLLVPTERTLDAAATLAALGFRPGPARGSAPPFDGDWRALHHSYPFHDGAGNELDLHWYLSAEARWPGADEPFWRGAVPIEIDGASALALAPTDQLYHVCAHASNSNTPHVRWLADALTLMRAHDIDWERLVGHARARRMVPALAETLGVLVRDLDAPVPPAVLATLAATRVSFLDRVEHAHNVAVRPYTLAAVLVRLWCWHRRGAPDPQWAWTTFPRFLRRYYGVADGRKLATVALRRATARLRREGFL